MRGLIAALALVFFLTGCGTRDSAKDQSTQQPESTAPGAAGETEDPVPDTEGQDAVDPMEDAQYEAQADGEVADQGDLADKDAGDALSDAGSDLADGARDVTEDVVDGAKDAADAVRDGVEDAARGIGQAGEDLGEGMDDAVKGTDR